jgi:N-acetylneuraminic acid mutarotase
MRSIGLMTMILACSVQAQSWVQLPDLPAIARDDGSAFAIGEEVYVGTGMDAGFQLTVDWYRFTPSTNTWTTIAPMPASGRQYCASFSLNGQGYVVGGFVGGVATAEVWRYDPPSDSWTAVAPLPQPMNAATAFVLNGFGHVVTGFLSNDLPSNLHFRYDPVNDSWSMLPEIPGPPIHRASSFAHAGKAYVVGGSLQPFEALASMWSFDPGPGLWEARSPLPASRFSSDAVGVGDGGVMVGGATAGPPFITHDEVWHYETASDQWQAYPTFPAGTRRSGVIAFAGPDRVYFGTGSDMAARYNDWWMLEVPVTVEERDADDGPLLGPVPADDHLNLTRRGTIRPAHIRVTDSSGRLIHEEDWNSTSTALSTGAWSSGVYLITVEDGTSQHHRRSIIQH